MIVQNLRDPATPLQGAQQMHAALGQRAHMLRVDQGGHAIYLLSANTCANDLTTNFLVTGVLPGDNTLCPPDQAATPFFNTLSTEKTTAQRELMGRIR